MRSWIIIPTLVLVLTTSLPASAPELSTTDRIALICVAQVLDAARAAVRACDAAYRVARDTNDLDSDEKRLMVASGALCAWIVVHSLSEGLRDSLKKFRDDIDEDVYDSVNHILRQVSSIAKSMPPEEGDIHSIHRANQSASKKINQLSSQLAETAFSDEYDSNPRSL